MNKPVFYENLKETSKKAADIIAQSINKLLSTQEQVVLGIPGGRSVSRIFKKLKGKNIPWKKVHIFMIDERMVSIEDDESNFRLAMECFFGELIDKKKLPEQNIYPFIPGKGIKSYEKELKDLGGSYDIILLSSGEDGHIGALYPNHSIKDESEYYLTMNDSPKPPKDRMTSSRKLLLRSKVAILLFFEEAKRDALNRFQDKKLDINDCPAKLLNYIKDSYILTDLK
jgi:6-phosphogluconolactonase